MGRAVDVVVVAVDVVVVAVVVVDVIVVVVAVDVTPDLANVNFRIGIFFSLVPVFFFKANYEETLRWHFQRGNFFLSLSERNADMGRNEWSERMKS